jgi:hypothetical protein
MFFSRARSQSRWVVLPPQDALIPEVFWNVDTANRRYDGLLADMQRFRGRVYLADGAIREDALTKDGRHHVAIDHASWHVLSLDDEGRVCACLRYLEEAHARRFDDLWVKHAAVSRSPKYGTSFREAVEREMKLARLMKIGFGEVGGWAVAEERRWTLEPLNIILATYALLEMLGSCTGLATATFRHGSASILRRIGLSSLNADGQEIPPYYDPQYDCQMEILRFDSRLTNPKYRDRVREFCSLLAEAPVLCRGNGRQPRRGFPPFAAERDPSIAFEPAPLAWA